MAQKKGLQHICPTPILSFSRNVMKFVLQGNESFFLMLTCCSAFSFVCFINTLVFWGIVADRYGRKPVIIIGTIAVVILNTLFGLVVNYWMAITTRFLIGSLNGLLGPTKAYASEVLPEEHQALGMSTVSTAWAIGLIIGPALGVSLPSQQRNIPVYFPQTLIFGRFPYFLPCLCISLFALGVTVACSWLPETIHNHNQNARLHDDSFEALETASCGSNAYEINQIKG